MLHLDFAVLHWRCCGLRHLHRPSMALSAYHIGKDRYSAADSESNQCADFEVAGSAGRGLDHLMPGRGLVGVDIGFWVREAGSSLGLAAVSFWGLEGYLGCAWVEGREVQSVSQCKGN